MKRFVRGKTSQEFIDAAKGAKLEINSQAYERGGDWIAFNGIIEGVAVDALFNAVNSRVIGRYGQYGQKFSTDEGLDGAPWFDAVLDLANTNDPPVV